MPQIKYTTYQIKQQTATGLESISKEDSALVSEYVINSTFNPNLHQIELHIYSLDDELLYSNPFYNQESFLQGAESAGDRGASRLTLNPENDAINNGYPYGDVKLVYNFINNLYSNSKTGPEYFIEEISADRREIRLLTTQLEEKEVIRYTNEIKTKLESTSYFAEFKLNLKNNIQLIGVNIDLQLYRDNQSVIVKLYNPLPEEINIKTLLTIEEEVSDSIAFQTYSETIPDTLVIPSLRSPNFSLETHEDVNISTEFLSYNELFQYPTENKYREVKSLFEEKGIEISIDYTDKATFIHFSSLEERVRNFKYKLDLINSYQILLDSREENNSNSTLISGSREYYKGLIDLTLTNFDHYDRHLYYESGSTSWPKTNLVKPYVNDISAATGSWWTQTTDAAFLFDKSNPHQLLNAIPIYLREDSSNENYNIFINMLSQHFDNLWIYTKAVTDKYDNDNRLNRGIPKDLVQDALKNFGVKLYTSNRTTQNLFKMFTGELYQTGSEKINTFITASNLPTSEEDYRKEVYKRVYHNLPLLLKSKGTEKGLQVLLNSFGIPTLHSSGSHSGLLIRTAGGTSTSSSINFGPATNNTGSLAKIRIDNTGEIVEGNTLSIDTGIIRNSKNITDDINTIDIGYSP